MEDAKDKNSLYYFDWHNLGNIQEGRKNLGESMPVAVYRMMELSMKYVLHQEFGKEKTDELFREAGYIVGREFAQHSLNLQASPEEFLAELTQQVESLKIGILRFEEADFHQGKYTITVHEDLDCSGLPPTDEVVCSYDEGLLSGILEAYTTKPVKIREVDCWASGHRVCRFRGQE